MSNMTNNIKHITSSEYFAELCDHLFMAEYQDFWQVDDSGGDRGIDGYSAEAGILFQYYCPEKPAKADQAKYKRKISQDLAKAKKLIDEGELSFKKWVFVTPEELQVPVIIHLVTEAKKIGLKGITWSNAHLSNLLTKYPNIRMIFRRLINEDIERALFSIQDRQQQVDEVRQEFQTAIDCQYDSRISHAKQLIDEKKYKTSKHECELILNDLKGEKESVNSSIMFRAYYNLAVCEANLHNIASAAIYHKKAYETEPHEPMAVCMLAMSKMLSGQPEEGLTIIDTVIDECSVAEQAISIKAKILWELGKQDELLEFLKAHNQNNSIGMLKGQRLRENGKALEAISAFKRVADNELNNIHVRFLIADTALNVANEETCSNPLPPDLRSSEVRSILLLALDSLREANVLLNLTEQTAELETCHTYLAGILYELGKYNDAIDAAETAIAINKDSKIAWTFKGCAQFQLSLFYEAIQSFKRCEELNCLNAGLAGQMCIAAIELGQIDIALELVEAYLESDGCLDLLLAEQAIELYQRQLDTDNVMYVLKRLEEEYPNNSRAIRLRADYASRHGKDEAEDLYKRAIRTADTESDKMLCELKLGNMYYNQGNYKATEEVLAKHTNNSIDSPANLTYCRALFNQAKYPELLKWLEGMTHDTRNNTEFVKLEAYVNYNLNILDRASALFKSLYRSQPKHILYAVAYGICRCRLGFRDEARSIFDAVREFAYETQELIALSNGYLSIGDLDASLELAYRARMQEPNDPEVHFAFIDVCIRMQAANKEPTDNKYSSAFQESIVQYNQRFPEAKGIQKYEIVDDNTEELLDVLNSAADRTEMIIDIYKSNPIPLTYVSRYLDINSYFIWMNVSRDEELGIRMSTGNIDERRSEASIAKKCIDDFVVVDICTLFLFKYSDSLQLLNTLFKCIYVHQSVLDELHQILSTLGMSQEGRKSVARVDGNLQLIEMSKEEVKKDIEFIEGILSYITEENRIVVKGLCEARPKDEKKYLEKMNASTRDSLLLAKELEKPLLCDDYVLRYIAKHCYEVESISTQSLMDAAIIKRLVSFEEKHEFTRAMLELNYGYLAINAMYIHSELKLNNYDEDCIRTAVAHIAHKETSHESLVIVLSELIMRLLIDPDLDFFFGREVFKSITSKIEKNHNIQELLQTTADVLVKRYPLFQIEKVTTIHLWGLLE